MLYIGGMLVHAIVDKGVAYLQAVNANTAEAKRLASKITEAEELAHEAAYKAESGRKADATGNADSKPSNAAADNKRRSWSIEDKIACAKHAIEHGNQAAADKFGVSKGMAATLKSHYNTGKLK